MIILNCRSCLNTKRLKESLKELLAVNHVNILVRFLLVCCCIFDFLNQNILVVLEGLFNRVKSRLEQLNDLFLDLILFLFKLLFLLFSERQDIFLEEFCLVFQ